MRSIKKVFIDKTGLTLVELITALVILGIILAPISYMFYNSQVDYLAGKRKIDAQREINDALRDIVNSLNQVESSEVDVTYNTIEILDMPVDPVSNPEGNDYFILRYDTQEIIYGIEDGKLYKGMNTNVSPATNRKNVADLPAVLTALTSPNKQAILGNVKDFRIITNGKSYEVTVSTDPEDFGNSKVDKITLTNKFTPRFDMNIR